LSLNKFCMHVEQLNSASHRHRDNGLPRPVLIVSKEMVREDSTFLERLLAGLAGESVHAALVCTPDCDVRSVTFGIIEVIRHPAIELPFFGWYNRNRLFETLAKFRPTVLHCLCRGRAAFTRQLARQLNLPYVLTVNSVKQKKRRLSISSRRCAKITVPAPRIAADVAKLHPRFEQRIEQVNIAAFVSDQSNCFSGADRITSMVTTAPAKNDTRFENLLEALRRLAIEGHEFLVVVMDAPAGEKHLRKAVTTRGLSTIVVRVPQIRPSRAVVAAGDIFIRFTAGAAFEPLLLEAMSLGTAVAACKGGVDQLIIDGQTASVFDPDDELSIYNCLQELLNTRELARQLAARAQQYLRENNSLSSMISAFLRIYTDAPSLLKR